MVGARSLLISLVRVVLVTTIGLCFASWLLYLIIKPQIWLNSAGHKWNAAANGTQIYYHYVLQNIPKLKKVTASVRKSNGVVLEYNFLQDVILNFGSIFVAAACCYMLWAVRNRNPKQRNQTSLSTRIKVVAKRILFFDVYPRKFWAWWCGGLNVLDALVMLTVIAFSLMWSYFTVHPKYKTIRGWTFPSDKCPEHAGMNDSYSAQIAQGKTKPHAAHLNMVHQTSSSIGTATQVPMLLFFLPVTKNSFLHYMFNTDFGSMVKYHKWIGYLLCYMIIVHGAVYYAYWSLNSAGGTFRSYFFKWGNDHSNNLAGSIAGLFTLIILFSSWSWMRRNYFQVFMRLHAVGYIGFLIFSFIHFWARWYHVAPSIILLALDWTFRLVQWLHPSWVTGRFVTADKSIITLEFQWQKSAMPIPGQSIWINMPGERRTQWHPVSIADVDKSGDGPVKVTAHMKCYGNWTTQMVAQMMSRGKMITRAEGPYGQPYGPRYHRFNVVVIFAGGIGVTPMLGMLRDIVGQRKCAMARQGKIDLVAAFPTKVYVHWSCRGMAEFALLDKELLNAHREENGWLTISLYTTRSTNKHGVRADLEFEEGMNKLVEHQPTDVELPRSWKPIGGMLPSTFGFKPAPLEGQGGICLRIVATTLAFIGAFFGLIMAMAYDKNFGLTTGKNKAYWKTAVMVIFGLFVGAMGLPACILYPCAIYRKRKHAMTEAIFRSVQSGNFKVQGANEGPQIMTHDHLVGTIEAPGGIKVQDGRPAIGQILNSVIAQHSQETAIGVFVAGPEAMANDSRIAVAEKNDTRNKPYLDYSSYAFQL